MYTVASKTATFQAKGQSNELLFNPSSALSSSYSAVLSWPYVGFPKMFVQPFCQLGWETGPFAK